MFIQEQADWNQTDNSKPDFIKNKPKNVSVFTNDVGYMTEQDIFDDLAAVAISGDYADIKNTPEIPIIPTRVSFFTNDVGYLTQHQNILVTDVKSPNGNSLVMNKVATIPNIYMHNIAINGGHAYTRLFTTLITSFSTPFDVSSFISYVNNLSSGGFMCSGTVRTNASGIATGRAALRIEPKGNGVVAVVYQATGAAGLDDNSPVSYSEGSDNLQFASLTDTVIPIIM